MRVRSSSSFKYLQQIPSSLSRIAHLDGNGGGCEPKDSCKGHTGGLGRTFESGRGRLSETEGAEGTVESEFDDIRGNFMGSNTAVLKALFYDEEGRRRRCRDEKSGHKRLLVTYVSGKVKNAQNRD